MSYALNNITTANEYVPANTLQCDGTVKLNIQVNNKAIYFRYIPQNSAHPGRGNYNPEVLLQPNTYLLARRAVEIAVRSAVAGEPAQVTIEALTPLD